MKNCVCILVLVIAVGFVTSCGRREEAPVAGDLTASAQALVGLLANEDFASAARDFDSTMKAVLPPDKLKEAWQSLTAQAGPFQRQVSTRAEKTPPYDIVFVTCECERATVDVKVVFNSAGQVTGLWFGPG